MFMELRVKLCYVSDDGILRVFSITVTSKWSEVNFLKFTVLCMYST